MGLGYGKREWDDYEWFPSGGGRRGPAVLAEPGDPDGASAALVERVLRDPIWEPDDAPRILLVDLDNLRAGPVRWRARMAVVVALARQADHVALAGQEGAVRRARPHLEEFAEYGGGRGGRAATSPTWPCWPRSTSSTCPTPSTWWSATTASSPSSRSAARWSCVSPGRDALSDSLAAASVRVIDLAALEHDLPAPARA